MGRIIHVFGHSGKSVSPSSKDLHRAPSTRGLHAFGSVDRASNTRIEFQNRAGDRKTSPGLDPTFLSLPPHWSRRRPAAPGWVSRAKRAVPEGACAHGMPSSAAGFCRRQKKGSETHLCDCRVFRPSRLELASYSYKNSRQFRLTDNRFLGIITHSLITGLRNYRVPIIW
jgi:hypothetical protein